MKNRQCEYQKLRKEMEDVGFIFEREQRPHHQNRREKEFKFIHPELLSKWKHKGYKSRAKKFYIKPVSDDPDCEIGLVTGKSSPLRNEEVFASSNSFDSFDNNPAWVNQKTDKALYKLLHSIKLYLSD